MSNLNPGGLTRVLNYLKTWVTNLLSSKSDTNHSHAWNDIASKPSFANVATSGSYNDLSNKPTIPTVNNATLTIQKNSSNVATFTSNASSNVTANISVPTKTSELTNNSGYLSGTVGIANGGTGATTRLGAAKNLTNENVGTSTQYFFTLTENWGKVGYASVADAKSVLGVPSIDLRPQASADANTVSDGVSITHYGSNGPSASLGASTNDGALFQQCWSSAWKVQIAADYRNGNLFTRGKNNGTWQPWRAVAYHGDNVSKFTNDSGYITSSGSCNYANSAGSARTVTDSSCINPTSGNYTEGIRFNKSTNGWATITIGTASGTTNGAMNGTGWGIFCDTSDNFIINNFDSGTANAALYCSDTNTYIPNLHISGGYKIYVG